MATVVLSPKFQVVIPKDVREALGLKAGEKVQVFQYGDRIEFVPLRKLARMRGFLKGIDTDVPREADRA